jgi:hypothetical protein
MSFKQSDMKFPPAFVLIDTNIWEKERLLKSSLGAALLFVVRQIGAKIALPEVTEMEIVHRIIDVGTEAVEKIKSSFVTVQAIMGFRPDYELPSRKEFEESARKRLSELADVLYRVDLSVGHVKSSLGRVIQHASPNKRKEQFRDSLLWEAALELAESSKVYFITADSDFFQDAKINKGLANDLLEEIKEKNLEIQIHGDISSFLNLVSKRIRLPEREVLVNAIREAVQDNLLQYARERIFYLGELKSSEVESYLTEQKDLLAITFTLSHNITDVQQVDGTILPNAVLSVMGDCLLNIETKEVSDIQLWNISCVGPHGELIPQMSMTYARFSGIVLGVRKIPYSLRCKLRDFLSQD